MTTEIDPNDALRAVAEGHRPHETRGENDEDWCALVARGRIVERLDDGTAEPYRTRLAIVEHPELPPGECYALFSFSGSTTAYRCRPEDARAALKAPGSFNLG